jgi:hypothetical protein
MTLLGPPRGRCFTAVWVALFFLGSSGCDRSQGEMDPLSPVAEAELLHDALAVVTSAMMESVTSPPVASRTYAYSSVAAYEAMRPAHPAYSTLAHRLNGLEPAPQPELGEDYLFALAGVNAFLTVAEAMVFAPEVVAAHRDSLIRELRALGVPGGLLGRSMDYGAQVGKHVLAWSGDDNIKQARASHRLEVVPTAGRWLPTPPVYMSALEPHWATLRPFAIASPGAIPAPEPAPYDMTEGSAFHSMLMEVYETGRNLTPEQREIASFWDCNPFAVLPQGHMMSAVKKISPGGHWMGITSIALRRTGADPMRAAHAYAHVSVAVADGFISSWSNKYRTVRVRPVTVIQEKIDRGWQPILQTPPFPEYTSGHSVISAAASEVLSDLFGEGFAFEDDTEIQFGLPVRAFSSFREAAEEAAISRLYGGIHYRDAIEHGLTEGRAIARIVLERMPERGAVVSAASGAD